MLTAAVEYFDREENSVSSPICSILVLAAHQVDQTGALTSQLSENPQKVNGLAGITLGAIVQSIATLIAGSILGLCFIWKVALVAIACIPLLVSAGYIRLVSWTSHIVEFNSTSSSVSLS